MLSFQYEISSPRSSLTSTDLDSVEWGLPSGGFFRQASTLNMAICSDGKMKKSETFASKSQKSFEGHHLNDRLKRSASYHFLLGFSTHQHQHFRQRTSYPDSIEKRKSSGDSNAIPTTTTKAEKPSQPSISSSRATQTDLSHLHQVFLRFTFTCSG